MKIAVIGSRNIDIENLGDFLPENVTEIVSGGARGVDTCARAYAEHNGIRITEFLPDYPRYGRSAPIRRNDLIVNHADEVLAFWDGKSRGTKYVIDYCHRTNKKVTVHIIATVTE